MKPTWQIFGPSTRGETGDCFSACVASILEIKLMDVPHFYATVPVGQPIDERTQKYMDRWFLDNGVIYVELALPGPLERLLPQLAARVDRMHYILQGVNDTGNDHAVVCYGAQIVHDPASVTPHGALRGPCRDGFYRFGLLAKRV